jgi:phosphoribosylformylglycinamidine synthase
VVPRPRSTCGAAQGGDPARAGRQLACRDGLCLHRGRLRGLRRAHDRPADRPRHLADFKGVVACGGFSYGDTLGAGIGWARSITFNPVLAEQFKAFFGREDTFGLGVCNGCQMFAELADIIPGAEAWPRFTTNRASASRRACRWSKCWSRPASSSQGMAGSRLPIAVAHGEGYANFAHRGDAAKAIARDALRRQPRPADRAYPFNPNGSAGGLTSVTTADGRFTALMPHPERVFRNIQMSWTPGDTAN